MLLEIQGEPTADLPKVLGLDDIIDFGKYKGMSLREIIDKDWGYVKWAILSSQRLFVDIDAVIDYHNSSIIPLKSSDIMKFGKYKDQTLASINADDANYLKWLEDNNSSFRVDWESFK